MGGKSGSRYILGHLGYKEVAKALDVGQEAMLVLNPEEPKALYEASKNIKAAFLRVGKRCVVSSQRILVDVGEGVWKQSHFLTVTNVPLTHVESE